MLLRVLLYCCVASGYWVEMAFAEDFQDIQTRYLSGQSDTVKLLQDVNNYLEQSPNNFGALFLKARLLEQGKEFKQAEVLYRQIIKAYPKAPEPYNNLASLLVRNGKLSEAQSLLEKAMRTHPAYATVYNNLSQVYVAMARNSYGKALQLSESNIPVSLASLNSVSSLTTDDTNKDSITLTSSISGNTKNTKLKKTETIAPEIVLSTADKSKPDKAQQDRNEIIMTLEGWAAAWSEQATDVYFIFYADDYHPPGQSRIAWKKERRIRLNKPRWIQIGIDGIDVKFLTNQEAKVELVQEYRASNYQDKTRKALRLRQTADGWRIIEERNLVRIN
ncbi:hypothetical protein MNBD_GAMMA21-157 [hydrothermal vent metagenome]|uniref:Uncharacterized protein n=1 Tax=hydrothermal vent metagenome TaxID=652676 RepID=A0A3B0ZX98_9ZZZZ